MASHIIGKTQIKGLQKRVLKIHRPKGGNKERAKKTVQ
jgi:hypothetical protein